MVLDHVAQGAGAFVVAGAAADAFGLRYRDLHVVDVFLIEQRFEDAVGEAQNENVLDRFLAEIVIDAVDLPLVEDRGDGVVDAPGAGEVLTDWLFDDDARVGPGRPFDDEAGAIELLHGRHEQRRRNGEVVQAVAGQAALVLDDVEARAERRQRLVLVDRSARPEQPRRKDLPRVIVDRPARKRVDAASGKLAKGIVAHRFSPDADDGDARRQQAVKLQVVERRQELPMGEIARATEDDDRHAAAYVFLTACPPNWLRSTASIRSA